MKKVRDVNKENEIRIIIIVFLTAILLALLFIYFNRGNVRVFNFDDETVKELTADDIEQGVIVNDSNINLLNYDSNITITKGGVYNLSGRFAYSVLVDSNEKVTLNINNVYIESTKTAAIANRGSGDLVINIPDKTTSTLKDGGSSEFDGCIYSTGKLYFEGSGKLYVYGQQEEGEGIATTDNDITINGGSIYIESKDDGINAGGDNGGVITINSGYVYVKASGDGIDSNKSLVINGGTVYVIGSSLGGDAGIDTDKGFVINGGTVIALGSDMLQNPDSTSKQKYVSFNMNAKISKDLKIELKDGYGNSVVSFTANEDFKTLIISSSKLTSETYTLYIDGTKSSYSKTIN